MDFSTITANVDSIIRSSAKEGGTTDAYKDIPSVDAQREIIVSHMKSDYSDKTLKMLNAKAFADTANTYKNLATSTEGEIEKLRSNASELETKIHTRESDLKLNESRKNSLLVFAITVGIVVGVYSAMSGFEYVHAIALTCLAIGFGYMLYLRDHPESSPIELVTSTTKLLSSPVKIPTGS
jgi:hypothetical protein